jgi:hypothetical protein
MKTKVTRSQKKPEVPSGFHPTHGEISARAQALWLQKGCPQGADEEIWLEAERHLRLGAAGRLGDGKGALSGLRPGGFRSDSMMSELDQLYPSAAGKATTSL